MEKWFVGRGVPHLIPDYSAAEDIFTRAFPFLALVMFTELFLAFSPDVDGWNQLGLFVAGVGFFVAVLVAINILRGRRRFQRPNDIGPLELLAFVVVPPALRVFSTGDGTDFFLWAGVNVGILVATYLITSYGLFPMIPWGLRQMRAQLGGLGNLLVKSLPLLLLFSAFLFVNAEIWQVAADIPDPFYAVVIALLVLLGSSFVALAQRHTLDNLNEFSGWGEVEGFCAGTPLAGLSRPAGDAIADPLARGERANLALLLFVAQSIQILLVALTISLFYVVFGLFTVREATILQWTAGDAVESFATWNLLGHDVLLSRPLVMVAGIIGAFSGLQFAVSVVNDDNYRREFADGIAADVRQALAVRCRVRAGFTD